MHAYAQLLQQLHVYFQYIFEQTWKVFLRLQYGIMYVHCNTFRTLIVFLDTMHYWVIEAS